MKIEKNGNIFFVKENEKSWTIERKEGKLTISYNVPKEECATWEALVRFVSESEAF